MSKIHNSAVIIGNYLANTVNKSSDEKEVLIYGVERLLNNILWLGTLATISGTLGVFKVTMIITLVYIINRTFFGGSHVEKDWICILLSIIIPLIGSLIVTNISINILGISVIYLIAYMTAVFKGVVDNPNKRLPKEEKDKRKRIGLLALTLIFLLNLLTYNSGNINISEAMSLGVLLEYVNLYFGK